MFWNDPNLYSVTYKDITQQNPYLGAFQPWQAWQTTPRFMPTPPTLQPTFYNAPYQVPFNVPFNPFIPYMQAQPSFNPYNVSPFAMTPFHYGMPPQIPYRPFGI